MAPVFLDLNVSTDEVFVFVTSLAALISSFSTTKTPLPMLSLLAATLTALYKFSGPSALIDVALLIAPTKTTGLSDLTTKFKK